MQLTCPCNSHKKLSVCCQPLIAGRRLAATPEELMRSRYVAYTLGNIDYISKTMKGPALASFDYLAALAWAQQAKWLGLNVVTSSFHQQNPRIGYVEFKATYVVQAQIQVLHEKSEFHKEKQTWFYVDGQILEDD